ncbi:hypothetical protein IFM89_031451 [Coptis chinensis]|uniref:Transposase MuDR plant domain-containing protein n=1 Tax=Coptis chinensis TaxID=261450 RepID=A0A835HL00_9MAGN|nr:hypothetical protein IFM89_031451 [Coptis chinensis]
MGLCCYCYANSEIKMRALMVLFDKNDLIIYVGGSFKLPPDAKEVCHSHYKSEWDSLMMRAVDGDDLNMMDFKKDILKLVEAVVGLQLSYITNGKLVYVNTDGELLQMCGLLAPSKDGFCRIYADLDLGGVDDFLVMTPRISTPVPNALSQLSQVQKGDDTTLLEIKRRVAKKGKKNPTKVASKPKHVKRKHQKELARLKATGFEDELDDDLERERVPLVIPSNPTVQVGKANGNSKEVIIDGLHPEEGYHNSHSSEDDREFEIPPGDEYYRFEAETSNVYFEPEMEMPMTEVVELKHGCPWLAYWRCKDDGFTMKLNTLFNVHTCSAYTDHKNSMADANWKSRVMEDHMKVHYKSTTPQNIIDEVRQKYHVAINYWTA